MRYMRSVVALLVLDAGLLAAQRDSAGIRIVDVAEARLTSLPEWKVEGPKVRIGEGMSDPPYEFHLASSPWRLSDGRIVVANDQVELRFFDSTGRYLTTIGRRGRGPGEYQQLGIWRAPGDSLLVTDYPTGRVDLRDPNGRLVRSTTVPRGVTPAWLSGGVALASYRNRLDLSKPAVKKDTTVLRKILADGRAADTVATLGGGWSDILGGGSWRGVRLAGTAMLSSGPGGAVFVDGDELALHWFAEDGRHVAITRVAVPRARVTNADIRADNQAQAADRARYPRLQAEGRVQPPTYAQFVPQATRVRLDASGQAWVRRWNRWGAKTAEWIVFAPRGAPIARVRLPAQFDANDIGTNYLLGIALDADGVQAIHQYKIRR